MLSHAESELGRARKQLAGELLHRRREPRLLGHRSHPDSIVRRLWSANNDPYKSWGHRRIREPGAGVASHPCSLQLSRSWRNGPEPS
jgi:hypothetical protein